MIKYNYTRFINPDRGALNACLSPVINLLFLLVLIVVIVPLSPQMPSTGLDPSWAMALNQAVAQGLLFGKDIIFTLGPYASIYTKMYHPAVDAMMLYGSVYFALLYWLAVLYHLRGKQQWIVFYTFFFLTMIYARDALFLSYPLMIGLFVFNTIAFDTDHQNRKYPRLFVMALLFSPMGLLALIKGSFLILCIVVSVLCLAYSLSKRQMSLAIICILSPIVSSIIFWLIAGQTLSTLPLYFKETLSISAGFTQAMSTSGNINEVWLYLMLASAQLGIILSQKKITMVAKTFLSGLFTAFLFVSFKAAFTRHFGHAYIAATAIMLSAVLLVPLIKGWFVKGVLVLSILSGIYIDSHYTHISIRNNILSNCVSAWFGLSHRLSEPERLKKNYDVLMEFLKRQADFPLLQGTSDIYSYHQGDLIASGNHWSPRPVFQSYSVFTSKEAYQNRDYLIHHGGPDHIFFRIEPIDGKLAALDDGASWPAILSQYAPIQRVHEYLLLRKQKEFSHYKKSVATSGWASHVFDETILVPKVDFAVFVEIKLNSGLTGNLINLFYKQVPLRINLVLKDGSQRSYRIIANMAKSGFLLSPHIENTSEFAALYAKNNSLSHKAVISFNITTMQNSHLQWNSHFKLRFTPLEQQPPITVT